MLKLIAALVLMSAALPAQNSSNIGVRILLGITDTQSSKWDGSITARATQITSLEPWRFEGSDAIQNTSWTASTHTIRLFGGGGQFGLAGPPVVANGVIARLSSAPDDAELQVNTAQGNFSIRLADIPYGKAVPALSGRVLVDRVPTVVQITNDAEEQDFPAAATAKDGTIWLAYVEFRHNKDHNRLRANFQSAPSDFNAMKAPTGGDQILVRSYNGSKWTDPLAVTATGKDLYRPAIAIDGSGRPWVFWSQNEQGNFDLWARSIENGQPGRTVRITSEPGSDVSPAAAADSKGAVWVAWQAWRNGVAQIQYSVQEGNGFRPPKPVSATTANEWNPSIAADDTGRVTVAWDSYRNGNYDIYMRTATARDKWEKELPVAESPRYEAYPSIAYDSAGRLWCAYEEGGEGWGKDFGAYDTRGVALYQGRAVRLRGYEKNGHVVEPQTDPGALMPGAPSMRIPPQDHQNDSDAWLSPNPNAPKTRPPSRPAGNLLAPKNTLPRLHIDPSGRVWLAFRSVNPVWWNPIGTVWTEFVTSYDGGVWTAPVYLDNSGNLLDNRPALVSARGGELMIIGSSDGRRQFHRIERNSTQGGMDPSVAADPYNNDLFVNTIALKPGSGSVAVKEGGKLLKQTGVLAGVKAERDAVAQMHAYRLTQGAPLRIVRGEFHRHSEISMDGGFDGTLVDQWRYILDAAALDWVGCCDHDNGGGREYTWWIQQKLTDIFYSPGKFAPLFSYERSVAYPEGHRNVLFVQRGVRTLPRLLPKMDPESTGRAPDTQMLYRYLKAFDGVTASHTSATNMGTDWRDNDAAVETAVEIYQGDRQNYEKPGAPRSSSAEDAIGGFRPKGFVDIALELGYKIAFEASSDHVSTHMSFANVFATGLTREAVIDAFKKRHLYASTDNILADFRSAGHMMGDAFSTTSPPVLEVKLIGTAPFAKVHVIKDNQYVYAIEPKKEKVEFTWRDNSPTAGKTSYYYVRGEQENGELVWISPMWITYTGK